MWTPEAMLVSEGLPPEGIQIWVTCDATQSHGEVWAGAAVEGHVWVYGHTTARVCVDVCGSCYH